MRLQRMGLFAVALASMVSALSLDGVDLRRSADDKPRTRGNSSGHMPHQGKREMERRRKRMMKEPQT